MTTESSRSKAWAIGLGVIAVGALVAYVAWSDGPSEPTVAPRSEGAERTRGSSGMEGPIEAGERDVARERDAPVDRSRATREGSIGSSRADSERAVIGDGGTRAPVASAPSSTSSSPSPSASSSTTSSSTGAQGRPLEIAMPAERRLAIGEAIDGMAAMRLQELRGELAEARAAGQRTRVQRIERWIAELEAEAQNRNAALDRLHQQVPPERAAE